MKKKTKPETVPPAPPEEAPVGEQKWQRDLARKVKKPQRGPTQVKTQVTIRVDRELLNEAYAQMKADNSRLTDIVERGIYLALRERDHDLPRIAAQVRFAVNNATREQQRLLKGLLIAMMMWDRGVDVMIEAGEGREWVAFQLKCYMEQFYGQCKWFLESCTKMPDADAYLERYSRYGKTAEEIAKLGAL